MKYDHDLTSKYQSHPHWPSVIKTIDTLNRAGHLTYLAGGCVRDALIEKTPKDFDIATAAHPDQVMAMFPNSLDIGKSFGVIILPFGDFEIEIATFRRDGPYLDARRPSEVHFDEPKEDARRRDFTINALFYDPTNKQVIDYVNGTKDIAKKVLRTVGAPELRFKEDRLRMLRAIRIATQLGFRICPATYSEIRNQSSTLMEISRERIDEELKKILIHSKCIESLERLFDRSLANSVLNLTPALNLSKQEHNLLWQKIKFVLQHLIPSEENISDKSLVNHPQPTWTALLGIIFFYNNIDPCRATASNDNAQSKSKIPLNSLQNKFLKKFRFSNTESKEMNYFYSGLYLLRSFDPSDHSAVLAIYRLFDQPQAAWIYPIAILDLNLLQKNTTELVQLKNDFDKLVKKNKDRLPAPLITGKDLAPIGVAPGPIMGRYLDSLYEYQIFENIDTRQEALANLKNRVAYLRRAFSSSNK